MTGGQNAQDLRWPKFSHLRPDGSLCNYLADRFCNKCGAILTLENTMMNPTYHFARMRELLDEFEPSRERSLAATKLDECEMWLARCKPMAEAADRGLMAPVPSQ